MPLAVSTLVYVAILFYGLAQANIDCREGHRFWQTKLRIAKRVVDEMPLIMHQPLVKHNVRQVRNLHETPLGRFFRKGAMP
jgi:hypothetical protein